MRVELSCFSVVVVVVICLDYDECESGNACENGACVNTAGSFNCFCSPPLVLDSSQQRCVSLNATEGVMIFDIFTVFKVELSQ